MTDHRKELIELARPRMFRGNYPDHLYWIERALDSVPDGYAKIAGEWVFLADNIAIIPPGDEDV